jgi:cytochrome c peroxidase
MKISKLHVLTVILGIVLLAACTKDKVTSYVEHYDAWEYATISSVLDLPQNPHDYSFKLPNHLGGQRFQINTDLAILGQVIFYDKKVSANNTVSCATCHLPEKGFADPRALSEGFDGEETRRNSLALGSVVNFQSSYGGSSFGQKVGFFWDERASNVAEQSFQTIQDPIEMGMDLNLLGNKLLKEDYYQVLFDKAFHPNDNRNSKDKILAALSEFVNSIATFDSKFDRRMSNQTAFTAQETQGMNLYNENCASCHGFDMSRIPVAVANNGLDWEYEDKGVGERTQEISDYGVFKVPMLRNIGVTGPYMHDGRFETLEEVIEHYSSGLKDHQNLHPNLKTLDNKPKQMNFTDSEKAALVAFLNTLTDTESLMQDKFADPFK